MKYGQQFKLKVLSVAVEGDYTPHMVDLIQPETEHAARCQDGGKMHLLARPATLPQHSQVYERTRGPPQVNRRAGGLPQFDGRAGEPPQVDGISGFPTGP